MSFLTESLGTPTKAIADSLTKQIKKAHSSFLDLQRQITAIKEKQSNKENPHGWKVREVPLGVNNAALEQKIVEEQHAAAQKILSLILSAKQADAKQAYADRAEALTLACDGHKASVQRIVAANPGRYAEVNIAAVMEHATVILASKAIEAEVATDLAYDNVARKRADKQLAFQEMSASKQTLGDEDGDKPVTRSELRQWQAEMERNNKPRGRPPKTARDTHPKKLVTKELSTKKLALTKIRKKLATKTQNPLEVQKRTVAVAVGRTIAEASTSSPANSLPGMLTPPHILLHPPVLSQKEQ